MGWFCFLLYCFSYFHIFLLLAYSWFQLCEVQDRVAQVVDCGEVWPWFSAGNAMERPLEEAKKTLGEQGGTPGGTLPLALRNNPQRNQTWKQRHISSKADRDGAIRTSAQSHQAGQTEGGQVQCSCSRGGGMRGEAQMWLFRDVPHGLWSWTSSMVFPTDTNCLNTSILPFYFKLGF